MGMTTPRASGKPEPECRQEADVDGEGSAQRVGAEDLREQVNGTHHITIKGDRNEKVTGGVSLDAKSLQVKLSEKFAVDAAQEVHLKGGQKVVIEAGMELTIKVGGSFVKISADGVTVVGAQL